MKFWIVKQQSSIGVDNANVTSADMTPLPANVNFFSWEGNVGLVHYDDRPGLAERIYDPTPYLPFLDQFMALAAQRTPPITLTQAKTIKLEANDLIFHAKRQAPIVYLGQQWYATDDEVLAMNNLLSCGGANLGSQVNSKIQAPLDATLVPRINAANSANKDTMINVVVNAVVQNQTNSTNAALAYLQGEILQDPFPLQPPAPHVDVIDSGSIGASHVSNSGTSPITSPSVAWFPVDATTPVNMSFDDLAGLMAAINTRRANLDLHKRQNRAAINACTTIAQIIAVNLAAGWPTVLAGAETEGILQ